MTSRKGNAPIRAQRRFALEGSRSRRAIRRRETEERGRGSPSR